MSFRRTWSRFTSTPRTLGATPGVREAWHQGRRWYHVWVVDIVDPAVLARRAAVADALGTSVEDFSAGTPHVTVWVSGFTPPPRHPAEGRTVSIVIGRVNSFLSCPFLEVRSEDLRALRAGYTRQRDAENRPPAEDRYGPYLPHLTVARYTGAVSIAPLAAALRGFRRAPTLRCTGTFRLGVVDAWEASGEVYPSSHTLR